jgi:sodium/proline symporter
MILAGFLLYLVIVLVIGLYSYHRNTSNEDFLLAGRSLGPWMAALSERASGESAWLLLGLPAAAFAAAYVEIWTALGVVGGVAAGWFLIARKLREETEKYQALTLTEYLSARYAAPGDNSIRWIASIIVIFFYTLYVAAQFSGAGKTLLITFGIPETYGILLSAGVIIFYTLCGGFLAVAWTDFFQAIVMIVSLTVVPIAGLVKLGGFAPISAAIAHIGPKATLFGGAQGVAALLTVLSGLSWGLGYLAMPHLLTRFMSMRDPGKIRQGGIIALVWAIPSFTGGIMIGLVGLGLMGHLYKLPDPDMLMPFLAEQLLPPWLAGIVISGAIAAMMSTADSQLLVLTSAVGEDVYHKALGNKPSEQDLVRISRIVVFGVGLAGCILALTTKKMIMEMVSYAWGGIGAAFGPLVVLTLYWGRVTREGALAGMITGSLGTIVWSNIATLNRVVPERLAAFVLAFVVILLVSAATRPESGEKTAAA